MDYIYLSTEKDIKTLKPIESEDIICFYTTIEDCLTNQCLYDNPGIYYVYNQNEFKFDCLSLPPYKSKISFSKEVNVICIAKLDFKNSKADYHNYFKDAPPTVSYDYKYTIEDLRNDNDKKDGDINLLSDFYQFSKAYEDPSYNMNSFYMNTIINHMGGSTPIPVPRGCGEYFITRKN